MFGVKRGQWLSSTALAGTSIEYINSAGTWTGGSLAGEGLVVAASSPAQVVSLQKIQGQLQDPGALETVAHYLALLEEAFLVASLQRYAKRAARRRAAPPKLVTLNNRSSQ